jgi:hypothetical protein
MSDKPRRSVGTLSRDDSLPTVAASSRHCERSEAIALLPRCHDDCFVARSSQMTAVCGETNGIFIQNNSQQIASCKTLLQVSGDCG